ncbi:MAG TPA: hypothetical protein VIJ25_11055 [Methylococcales bacterium]
MQGQNPRSLNEADFRLAFIQIFRQREVTLQRPRSLYPLMIKGIMHAVGAGTKSAQADCLNKQFILNMRNWKSLKKVCGHSTPHYIHIYPIAKVHCGGGVQCIKACAALTSGA